jgi:hypothetical protein
MVLSACTHCAARLDGNIWRTSLNKTPIYMVIAAIGFGSLSISRPTQADGFNPMTVMNPGKWFGKNNDHYNSDDDSAPPPPPPPVYPMSYGAPPGPGFIAPPPPVYAAPSMPVYAPPAIPVVPNYTAPATGGYYPAPVANSQASGEPSKEEMARRIKELENRLEDMEAKNRQSIPAPQPTTPPPSSYQYYSGDQTPGATTQYPFRPMNANH